jgi:hypothetical protein
VPASSMPSRKAAAIDPEADAAVRAEIECWLTRAVIGLNLCPFAKAVHAKAQIRYAISAALSADGLLADLEHELRVLDTADAQQVDTTLLIAPHVLVDFADYNDFLVLADHMLTACRLVGTIQIASFHPDYVFDGSAPDDIENYTNRAPFPILHLLREASVERAVGAFPEADEIVSRNQHTLHRLGHAGWQRLMTAPDPATPGATPEPR